MDTLASHDDVSFRGVLPGDVDALPPVARRIFTETFESRYGGADFDAFCDVAYGRSGTMARDLADRTIGWRIAEHAGVPVGYAKLRPWTGAPSPAGTGTLELQQIYVLSSWHGKGIAEALMQWAIGEALERGAPSLYLTVFDHNERQALLQAARFRRGRALRVPAGRSGLRRSGVVQTTRLTQANRQAHLP